jgi:hypothetical protein
MRDSGEPKRLFDLVGIGFEFHLQVVVFHHQLVPLINVCGLGRGFSGFN